MILRTPGGWFALFAALAVRLAAHDYWLEPAQCLVATGATVDLKLLVGEDLQPEEEREFALARTLQFDDITAAGRRDLSSGSKDGAKPYGVVKLMEAGTHLIALQRRAATITLEAKAFTAYLKEEGLEAIVAERMRRGENERPGRERYARFLKCYLRAGDQPEAVLPRETLRLDIVPELRTDRPMQTGDELRVRVNFDGAPLKQAAVFAAVRGADGKAVTQQLVTGDQGEATVKLTAAGLWIVRLVHMQRAPAGDADADWESFWGACTFGVQ
jgi:uncharacterized GH25 family protein